MNDNFGSLIEALSRLVTACELEQQGFNGAKEGVATAAALGRETLDRIVHGVSGEAPTSEEDRAFVAGGMARLRAGSKPDGAERKLPRHKFWGAGEPDCPQELKAPNGELHTMRCKVCGDGWRESGNVCLVALGVLPHPAERSADHLEG